jgi:hypothetical protein
MSTSMPRLLRGVWMFAPVAAHAAPYFGERGKFFAFGLSDIEHNTRPGNPMTWADSPYKCRAEYGVKSTASLKRQTVKCASRPRGDSHPTLIVPKYPLIRWGLGLQILEKYGGDDETRTRDLCRDSAA